LGQLDRHGTGASGISPRAVWKTHDHVEDQVAAHEITASEAVVLNPNTRKSPQRPQKQKAAGRLVRTKLIPVSNAPSVSETHEHKHLGGEGDLPALGPLYMTFFVMLLWQATVWK